MPSAKATAPALPTGIVAGTRLYLRPLAATAGDVGDEARCLAGGALRFDRLEVVLKPPTGAASRHVATIAAIAAWADAEPAIGDHARRQLDRLGRAPAPILGLDFTRPLLMGAINLTPDSFSDGGDHLAPEAAEGRARAMVEAGAALIDLGAESTRPGAAEVPAEVQLDRLLPVLERLADLDVPISVDTRSAQVMRRALAAGAGLVNDVSGFSHDPEAPAAVAAAAVPVVAMHSRATPATMQQAAHYEDVLTEVYDALAERVSALVAAGVAAERIILDPGFGFAKTAAHNVALLSGLALLHGLGRPLLVGLSRKSTIARLSRGEAPKARLPGSLAAALWALGQGAQVLRVHDVGETRQAMAIWQRLVEARACS